MKNIIFLFFLFLSFVHCQAVEQRPVLIIGGGPTGLATAIELHEKDIACLVVEKRAAYTRERTVFLYSAAIKQLEKWQISVPEMHTFDVQGLQIGVVQIQELEKTLSKRVHELDIEALQGIFLGFQGEEALIATQQGKISIPYQVLVGADGTHSKVRASLGITLKPLGKATGAFAFLPGFAPELDICTKRQENLFVRKIVVPTVGSLVFAQRNGALITQKEMGEAVQECWKEEAERLCTGKADYFLNAIEVLLQQAEFFSCQKKRALLVGDAAATASFFQGMGANTALKTAKLAAICIEALLAGEEDAYENFEAAMQKQTGKMIEDSRYLFPSESA